MRGMDASSLAVERVQATAHSCTIVARGQIDLFSAPRFKTALADAIDDGAVDVVVDLTAVDFVDSTALGVLVAVHKRLGLLGGTLAIISGDETLRRVLELTGLADRISA